MATRYERAEEAALRLFGDTSIAREGTLGLLKRLAEHIDDLIQAVESDIEYEAASVETE